MIHALNTLAQSRMSCAHTARSELSVAAAAMLRLTLRKQCRLSPLPAGIEFLKADGLSARVLCCRICRSVCIPHVHQCAV